MPCATPRKLCNIRGWIQLHLNIFSSLPPSPLPPVISADRYPNPQQPAKMLVQASLFPEMLICRQQSSILPVTFGDALRCSLKQEVTKYRCSPGSGHYSLLPYLSYPTVKYLLARRVPTLVWKADWYTMWKGFFFPPFMNCCLWSIFHMFPCASAQRQIFIVIFMNTVW